MWHRLGEVVTSWYRQIADAARASVVLWADETGWRRNGLTCWLWCFASQNTCYYQIDRSRGGLALAKFFTEAFDGVLVYDFWATNDAIEADDHQCCLAPSAAGIGKGGPVQPLGRLEGLRQETAAIGPRRHSDAETR